MIVANNKTGKRVSIDNAIKSEAYFCPICNQPLIQKHGEIRQPHFAHIGIKAGFQTCRDSWEYDKTDWHILWQKRFPESCFEKVIANGEEKHIADVLINDIVIEFQHSSISLDEFEDRNAFYSLCGYKVVWVFDLSEEFSNDRIERSIFESGYSWSYPKKIFKEMNFKAINATIYFQFSNCDDEDSFVLEKVIGGYNRFTKFYTDQKHCLSIQEFVKLVMNDDQQIFKKKYSYKAVPSKIEGGRTIQELWKPHFSAMVVKNLVTKKEMIINGKDGIMYHQDCDLSKKIIGKYRSIGMDKKYYYSDYFPVWDDDKAIWILKKSFVSQKFLEEEEIDKNIICKNIIGESLDSLLNKKFSAFCYCLYDCKYYYLQFVNMGKSFNAFEFNPETGEIFEKLCNEEVNKLYNKKVWKEIIC